MSNNMMYGKESSGQKTVSDENLCRLAQQGDRNAEEQVVVRYFGLVKACADAFWSACLTVEEIPTADRKALVRYLRYDQQVVGKPATSVTFDNLDAAEAYMENCQQQYLMRYCGAVTIQDND